MTRGDAWRAMVNEARYLALADGRAGRRSRLESVNAETLARSAATRAGVGAASGAFIRRHAGEVAAAYRESYLDVERAAIRGADIAKHRALA